MSARRLPLRRPLSVRRAGRYVTVSVGAVLSTVQSIIASVSPFNPLLAHQRDTEVNLRLFSLILLLSKQQARPSSKAKSV